MVSDEAVPARALRGVSFSWGPRGTSGGHNIYLDPYRTKLAGFRKCFKKCIKESKCYPPCIG